MRLQYLRIAILFALCFFAFSYSVSGQMELGEVGHSEPTFCTGSIEVIAGGSDAPYTIEFSGGGNELLVDGVDGSYAFYELCGGIYSIVITAYS